MQQSDLGLNLSIKKTRKREFLEQMQQVVPWKDLVALIAPYAPEGRKGRPPFPVEMLLRIHFMQQWFTLSDPAMEEALHDMPLFRDFVGLSWDSATPDESTILRLLKHAWLESGGVYGYRKLTLDMRDMGEQCSRHRVARLLRCEGIKAQRGYGKRPRVKGGAPAFVAPNLLSQQFTVNASNKVWVTDITYISTHEGWLYLATVIDLFSRQVVGWATGSRIDTQLPLDALHMAIWRRRPRETVIVHSDQGCQFTSHEWQRFLASHNLQPSMSRRGNCHDNAVAESFFQLLKRERIRKHIYASRQEARSDVFSYIEMFYNPIRRHSSADGLSPLEFERRHSMRLAAI